MDMKYPLWLALELLAQDADMVNERYSREFINSRYRH
jgi:hypothetical protein